jgi:hypothetical protein
MPTGGNVMPTGGNVMPTGGNVMPTGGNVMPTGGNVMPIETNTFVELIEQIISLILSNNDTPQNKMLKIIDLTNKHLFSTSSTQLFTSPITFNSLENILKPDLNCLQNILKPDLNTLLNPSQLPIMSSSLNSIVSMLKQNEVKEQIAKFNIDSSILLKFFEEDTETAKFKNNLNKLRELMN